MLSLNQLSCHRPPLSGLRNRLRPFLKLLFRNRFSFLFLSHTVELHSVCPGVPSVSGVAAIPYLDQGRPRWWGRARRAAEVTQ